MQKLFRRLVLAVMSALMYFSDVVEPAIDPVAATIEPMLRR